MLRKDGRFWYHCPAVPETQTCPYSARQSVSLSSVTLADCCCHLDHTHTRTHTLPLKNGNIFFPGKLILFQLNKLKTSQKFLNVCKKKKKISGQNLLVKKKKVDRTKAVKVINLLQFTCFQRLQRCWRTNDTTCLYTRTENAYFVCAEESSFNTTTTVLKCKRKLENRFKGTGKIHLINTEYQKVQNMLEGILLTLSDIKIHLFKRLLAESSLYFTQQTTRRTSDSKWEVWHRSYTPLRHSLKKIRLSNYLINIVSRIMLLEIILPTV